MFTLLMYRISHSPVPQGTVRSHVSSIEYHNKRTMTNPRRNHRMCCRLWCTRIPDFNHDINNLEEILDFFLSFRNVSRIPETLQIIAQISPTACITMYHSPANAVPSHHIRFASFAINSPMHVHLFTTMVRGNAFP